MNDLSKERADHRVTMQDVAEQCGVSTATVSLVLSGDKRISPPTRKSVLAAVKQLGYRPHAPARSLALRSTRTLALVLPDIESHFELPLFDIGIHGIYSASTEAGYRLHLEMATQQFLSRHFYMRLLKEQSVDGMLYMTPNMDDSFLQEIVGQGFPFVQVGSYLESVSLSYVVGDNMGGAEAATQYLIKLGHKRIGLLNQLSRRTSTRDRKRGFENAMQAHQINLDPELMREGDFNMLSSMGAAKEIIKNGATAVFAANDVMASGVLQAAEALNLKVPEDVSVVGMDDLPLATQLEKPLSTVQCDIREIAYHAVKKLIEVIEGRQAQIFQEVLPTKLIARSTSGPVPVR